MWWLYRDSINLYSVYPISLQSSMQPGQREFSESKKSLSHFFTLSALYHSQLQQWYYCCYLLLKVTTCPWYWGTIPGICCCFHTVLLLLQYCLYLLLCSLSKLHQGNRSGVILGEIYMWILSESPWNSKKKSVFRLFLNREWVSVDSDSRFRDLGEFRPARR